MTVSACMELIFGYIVRSSLTAASCPRLIWMT